MSDFHRNGPGTQFASAMSAHGALRAANARRAVKTRQLCAAIERTLAFALACDVEDAALDDVALDRVEAVDGAFVAVFVVNTRTRTMSAAALAQLQAHLDEAMPAFKEAMARELMRKRVPTVTCVLA